MSETTFKCCICGKETKGHSHNANPLKDGRCCADCNMAAVVPERIRLSKLQQY